MDSREISILWLNLALLAPFTPSGEAGIETRVASFGTPLTRRHCTGVASFVATLASSRVTRSGETFKSVSFGLIFHRLRGAGMRGSRLRGNDGGIRVNDACNQCRGWRRDGARGSCRRLGLARPSRMRRSRLRGSDGTTSRSLNSYKIALRFDPRRVPRTEGLACRMRGIAGGTLCFCKTG